ncbi:hypothetical protein BVX99_00420 [bacterium F16]|nr:hypothetical protein BVX99_00420 [bacterium F16]
MLIACQKCPAQIEARLSGPGRVVRCQECHQLNAFLRHAPDGCIYFGDYKIIREAGQGANAMVSKVRYLPTGANRAIKMFCADEMSGHAQKEFMRESRTAMEMLHPNIIRVFASDILGQIPYVVMEFSSGFNMDQLLTKFGPIEQFDAMTIARYVLDALDYVWNEFLMIHRDIKPSNILLDKDGNVKVFDFGLVTGHEAAAVDLSAVEGTPYYLSPECLIEGAHLDNRSDIYSFGATLYHLIAGEPPFNYETLDQVINARLRESAPDLRNVFAHAHPAIVAIIQKMMEPEPDHRYFTAADCKQDVELVLAGQDPVNL